MTIAGAPPPLIARLDALAAEATRVLDGSDLAEEVRDIRARLQRPLRVAIAGRTKAGKSTLLNSLVGERLAATDATECTRIVTWYRYDLGYSVEAVLLSGERRGLAFDRTHGLDIRLGDLSLAEVERLEVGWPSSRLLDLTLIDTPGLDADRTDASERTMRALVGDEPGEGDADAVIYLMRHLHRRDAEFLEAFESPAAPSVSPVNAVALLSRADEVGAGRPDALASAARIAERYAADPRVSRLAIGVLPVAALLAATGSSLREDEVAALHVVAALEERVAAGVLLSVDRFRSSDAFGLGDEARERLLARLGLFGLRFAVQALRARPGTTAPELARLLVAASGIRAVETLIGRHFAGRAEALKARSALGRLRVVAERAGAAGVASAAALVEAVERLESSSAELRQLRLLHLVHARLASLSDDEVVEVDRLLGGGSPAERLGAAPGVPLQGSALEAIARWRTRASNALLDRRSAEAAEEIARAYEGLYSELQATS